MTGDRWKVTGERWTNTFNTFWWGLFLVLVLLSESIKRFIVSCMHYFLHTYLIVFSISISITEGGGHGRAQFRTLANIMQALARIINSHITKLRVMLHTVKRTIQTSLIGWHGIRTIYHIFISIYFLIQNALNNLESYPFTTILGNTKNKQKY